MYATGDEFFRGFTRARKWTLVKPMSVMTQKRTAGYGLASPTFLFF